MTDGSTHDPTGCSRLSIGRGRGAADFRFLFTCCRLCSNAIVDNSCTGNKERNGSKAQGDDPSSDDDDREQRQCRSDDDNADDEDDDGDA
jgi:hypothetical protein